jgi:hypothetical protein
VITYTTLSDVINHGFVYLRGNPGEPGRRDIVRAALEAYRDLANAFNWSHLDTHSRIDTSPAFDGSQVGATIAYDLTGGQYERMVTLTGAVWPDWAAEGTYIRVGTQDDLIGGASTGFVAYRVRERKSASVLTLTETLSPEADLAAGCEFVLYRDTYLLPEDYVAQDQALYEMNFGGMGRSR